MVVSASREILGLPGLLGTHSLVPGREQARTDSGAHWPLGICMQVLVPCMSRNLSPENKTLRESRPQKTNGGRAKLAPALACRTLTVSPSQGASGWREASNPLNREVGSPSSREGTGAQRAEATGPEEGSQD